MVTTPAYMRNSPIHVVRDGISKMVEQVLKMAWIVCLHTRGVQRSGWGCRESSE